MEQNYMLDFNAKKGFICDMDGVIYHENQILPGVAEFIQWLQEENKRCLADYKIFHRTLVELPQIRQEQAKIR